MKLLTFRPPLRHAGRICFCFFFRFFFGLCKSSAVDDEFTERQRWLARSSTRYRDVVVVAAVVAVVVVFFFPRRVDFNFSFNFRTAPTTRANNSQGWQQRWWSRGGSPVSFLSFSFLFFAFSLPHRQQKNKKNQRRDAGEKKKKKEKEKS